MKIFSKFFTSYIPLNLFLHKLFVTITLFIIFSATIVLCQENKTYALIVGLEKIDDAAYAKKHKIYSKEATIGVGLDIDKMNHLAETNGHIVNLLFNTTATKEGILNTISSIGSKVKKGDTFLFYFSGHGDVVKDISGDEISGFDQEIVAYNDFIIDDEIYALLNKYFTQTNNIMIVDACHSSTSWKFSNFMIDLKLGANKSFQNNKEQNLKSQDKFLSACNLDSIKPVKESFNLVYFGATEDDNVAKGDIDGGLLTFCLFKIINDAKYYNTWNQYSYRHLACELQRLMATYNQNLQYHEVGETVFNYSIKIPFKIY